MDKLRKIGLWVWYNKERMVLGVMFVALCFQVYKVWNPEPAAPPGNLPPPAKPTLTAEVDIPEPLPPKSLNPPVPIEPFVRFNPFTIHTSRDIIDTTEDIDVKLLQIIQWRDGSYRARLQTPQEKGWYAEGEAFSTYEVLRIDPEAKQVEVYSERLNKRVTLNLNH